MLSEEEIAKNSKSIKENLSKFSTRIGKHIDKLNEIQSFHPEIQWGKMCFAFCGDQCNCSAGERANEIIDQEYYKDYLGE